LVCHLESHFVTPREAYNKVAKYYDESFKSNTAHAEDEVIYSLLKKLLTQSTILDLGCGTGALLEHLDVKPENYVGIDISENMVNKAMEKFPHHKFYCGDMANLPFKDGKFDNVVSLYGGISYANPKTMQEILRLLKPKGKYFLMFFNSRYSHRKTYILNRHKLPVRFNTVKDVHLPKNCRKQGFNFHGDIWDFLPIWLITSVWG